MTSQLAVIGAPSSAGAYGPGQERAPQALRDAGLLKRLQARGIAVDDYGNVPGFRWRVDRANKNAMNVEAVRAVAQSVAAPVERALAEGAAVLVLGGDCTVELGTVAGAIASTASVGLVYMDLDTDLNTPNSTTDGALDWMGVAHLLGIEDTVPTLAHLGSRFPLLQPEQLHFIGNANSQPFERELVERLPIAETPASIVIEDACGAGEMVACWGAKFDRLLVHLDVDVLDYVSLPIAENYRRNVGLQFEQLIAALRPVLAVPNWTALTITELNPDHADAEGEVLRQFVEAIADVIAASPRWYAPSSGSGQ